MTTQRDERWMGQITRHVTVADWGLLPLNADAERWICLLKHEVLSRLMVFGEHSLWYTLQLP